ncbi:MAG: hypothetical protein IT438_03500 [Phycisphaerales bacterium]|nr:hypothetical protein [Phycisphaerales bacterium]
MPVLPDTKLGQLEYFEVHQPVWAAAPAAAVGLTAGATTLLGTLVTNARKSYDDMLTARAAAKNATLNWYDQCALMNAAGRDDIRIIKAFADSQPNPLTVYTLAQVDPPAPPGPAPIPGTPDNFRVTINPASGELTLGWKCVGDGTAVYIVKRRFANDPSPIFLGAVGVKTFTDTSLPNITGASLPVSYFVTCQRGAMTGAMASVTIRFGAAGGGGGGGFTVVENAPVGAVKMAA